MKYDERKPNILAVIHELGDATSKDVYENLDQDDDATLCAVRMALLRYHY